MSRKFRTSAIRRELAAADRIPYRAHVSETVVRTKFGDYLQVFRLGGASFECRDDGQLNNWHERLNVLWRNISSPNVALWTQVIRRRVGSVESPSAFGGGAEDSPGFANSLAQKYDRLIVNDTLMQNELYLSVLYRPAFNAAAGILSRLTTNSRGDGARQDLTDALESCRKLADVVQSSLDRYDPEKLGVYPSAAGWRSSLLEYLGLLINGEWQSMPLPAGPLDTLLATTRVLFGNEIIEYRTANATRLGAMLGIKEYPTPTTVAMLSALLSAPFPFIVTQSFAFLSKLAGQSLLQRQYYRMENAGDYAVSQAASLKDALDALTSNEFVMGDHHFSLQVMTECVDADPRAADGKAQKILGDHVALARSLLADTGMVAAREDLALEAGFWAQLPGNFPFRPRKAPISSRNFAALSPFHNFPAGRARGNHWGDALARLVTRARTPYHFSLHASDPSDSDGGARRDTGHTLICGPTGSGKTVFIGFLVTMLCRTGVTQIVFDKDRGLEILVRALGGEYLTLNSGVPTGLNPLQLPSTPENIEFLNGWLRELCRARGVKSLTRPRDHAELEQALRGTVALDVRDRRLSRLVEYLDPTDPLGPHGQIARWCESCGGEYAWVFDGASDSVVPRLSQNTLIAFDVTEFLGNEIVRSPLILYLFHLVRQLLDGRRLVCWLDEFWRLLMDPAFEEFAKDAPKTWRKQNGVICLATQSASDVLNSPLSRTLVEQTPTKIIFPNGDAVRADYVGGLGLSDKEFEIVRAQIDPGSRMFLIKQGIHSIVCQLDLKGFDRELAVISGRASGLERMRRLVASRGSDPGRWLPEFMNEESAPAPARNDARKIKLGVQE